MIDALISLMAVFVFALAVAALVEGGIRVQKWLFFRRVRKHVEEQERAYRRQRLEDVTRL